MPLWCSVAAVVHTVGDSAGMLPSDGRGSLQHVVVWQQDVPWSLATLRGTREVWDSEVSFYFKIC